MEHTHDVMWSLLVEHTHDVMWMESFGGTYTRCDVDGVFWWNIHTM